MKSEKHSKAILFPPARQNSIPASINQLISFQAASAWELLCQTRQSMSKSMMCVEVCLSAHMCGCVWKLTSIQEKALEIYTPPPNDTIGKYFRSNNVQPLSNCARNHQTNAETPSHVWMLTLRRPFVSGECSDRLPEQKFPPKAKPLRQRENEGRKVASASDSRERTRTCPFSSSFKRTHGIDAMGCHGTTEGRKKSFHCWVSPRWSCSLFIHLAPLMIACMSPVGWDYEIGS